MRYNVQIRVNDKEIPLNQFTTGLTTRIVLAIVESLKGIDEDISEVAINLSKK